MNNPSPSKIWRMQKIRYKLIGSYCISCKNVFYPVKEFCPVCHSDKKIKQQELATSGKIITWSIIHVAPAGFENVSPYPIALVKLDNGPVIFTQITDYKERNIKTGMRVEAVFRKLGIPNRENVIEYGIKFRPTGW